jgi:hypothetical protein
MIAEVRDNKQVVFQKLFERSFDYRNTTHTPAEVYVQTNESGRPCVMYAGHPHDNYTWYLQFAARFDGQGDGAELFDEFHRFMGQKYKYMLNAVENNNYPALYRCLKSGYIIIGTRTTTTGKILVELIKEFNYV